MCLVGTVCVCVCLEGTVCVCVSGRYRVLCVSGRYRVCVCVRHMITMEHGASPTSYNGFLFYHLLSTKNRRVVTTAPIMLTALS